MKKNRKSDLSGFWKLSIQDRQNQIAHVCNLNSSHKELLLNSTPISINQLEKISENVIGSFSLPFSVATNFRINNCDYIIPMVTEESSVVAAASNGARFCRSFGGFICDPVKSLMIGQIQITHIKDKQTIMRFIQSNESMLISIANSCFPRLVEKSGGAKEITFREIETDRGSMLILHVLVDVCDAMGANIVNTMVERIGLEIQGHIDASIGLKIISNYAVFRVAKCRAVFYSTLLGGNEIVDSILDAVAFAKVDVYRCVTHNKGIMNGIIALAIATGNDSRAIEAAAHSYAVKNGKYSPLTSYYKNADGNLVGEIEIPIPMGIVGSITKVHPMVNLALKILQITTAEELIQVTAAVGLAQNIAALRALVSEGIQKGHMSLHNKKKE
jgi:hydroxymethylglutaryl-CoA reductase